MLLEIRVCWRCFKIDGSAITESEYSQIGPTNAFVVGGIGEEERSVNLIGCALKLDAFKGRQPSERFFEAIGVELERFTSFLASMDEKQFQSFKALGIKSDLLVSFRVDESTMDFELPHILILAASRLGLSVSILVDP
jgi:hypothetical protein